LGQDRALPAFGVYVTRAYLREGAFPAVTNIGLRPTFDEDKPTVETFILDFQGEVYGQELRIELLHRLRGEVRFPNVEALREQIEKDVAASRAYVA
jgi:riboflavin kinase/FMN adenylyltransferase